MKKNQIAKLVGFFMVSVAVCLFLSANVFAQEEPEILPDDPLYQAKRQMETAQLNAGSDPLEKATLHTKYAKERLAEVKAMISKGKPEFVGGLVKDNEKAIGGATDEINRAQAQGRDVSEALEAVERSTKKHTEVLTDLLDKVPEQAKPAIRHAIEVSKRGRNIALDTLRKIQRGEIPGGRPEGIGMPEGIGRPEGIGSPGGGSPGGAGGGPGGAGGGPGGRGM
ncbi:MAG: hypothetical protein JSW12_07120 [Deltaproteobacteria bacterium]|nr:MAG: hypothetical protein JSW12_07120 [Deltaproteobacteria bacterium]